MSLIAGILPFFLWGPHGASGATAGTLMASISPGGCILTMAPRIARVWGLESQVQDKSLRRIRECLPEVKMLGTEASPLAEMLVLLDGISSTSGRWLHPRIIADYRDNPTLNIQDTDGMVHCMLEQCCVLGA